MNSSVIQGCFPNGFRQPLARPAPPPVAQRAPMPHGAVFPSPRPVVRQQQPVVQRFGAGTAMRLPDTAALASNRSTGQPLQPAVRQMMESLFHTSFADVRVHVGPHVTAIGATSFTQGSSIHFAPGQYAPEHPSGRQRLAYELAHVVQQLSSRVRNPFGSGLAVVHDAAMDAEAQQMAQRAVQMVRSTAHPPVIQQVKYNSPTETPPAGARGRVRYVVMNGVRYAIDDLGRRWYLNPYNTWTNARTTAVPTYNRFRAVPSGRGAPRAGSFSIRHGSGASYFAERRRQVIRRTSVGVMTAPNRRSVAYAANMLAATTAEGHCATNSATAYALSWMGAPAIPYNWCHLLGRGGGGTDNPDNLVSASTHCNSEQLAIERVLYQFRDRGVTVTLVADLYGDSQYLAEHLEYTVFMHGTRIWSRSINGFRADAPSFEELRAVRAALLDKIIRQLPSWR
jgi:hypothetical protein